MSYTTQMDAARQGIITPQMEAAAKKEQIDVQELRELMAQGRLSFRQTNSIPAWSQMPSALC